MKKKIGPYVHRVFKTVEESGKACYEVGKFQIWEQYRVLVIWAMDTKLKELLTSCVEMFVSLDTS